MEHNSLKKTVYSYWNKASCGTEYTQATKFSREYFEDIESLRYAIEPEIFSFAQFTRWHGKKVLEVGVGAGTDFLQWVRAGTFAYGIDLTQEAIDNVQLRLQQHNLSAQQVIVADAEQLPYENNFFDLTYSWGVIHHSPNFEQCLSELIRVTSPHGIIKIMIYNRHSLFALYRYILAALLKGKPFRSLKDVLWYDQESLGTKAYTIKEIKKILAHYPVMIKNIDRTLTQHDLLYYKSKPFRFLAYIIASIFGWYRVGWFMRIELIKK